MENDLLKRGKTNYQLIFNEVLESLGLEPGVLRTQRERVQRWLANERNAVYQLDRLDALRIWALWIRNSASNSDHRRIAKEIALMLRMPPIILGLYFQTDLGIYFETTIRWYSVSGELSDTPGLRMLELHLFLHDFIQPW